MSLSFFHPLDYGIMEDIVRVEEDMNIQQLRYVVAIANSGTFS